MKSTRCKNHWNWKALCATRTWRCQGTALLVATCHNLSQLPLARMAHRLSIVVLGVSGGNMRIGWRSVLLAVLVSALAANAGAQALYGSLVGNVTDETGAALPGATVTVTQRETNLCATWSPTRPAATTCRTCCPAPTRSSSHFRDSRPHGARHRRPARARPSRRRAAEASARSKSRSSSRGRPPCCRPRALPCSR